MELKQLLTDDEAVSPVIGVILMVAITVILAAVIGTFVLGLGDQVQSTSPQASFNFDYTADDGSTSGHVEVTHDGGDSIPPATLTLRSDSASIEGSSGSTTNADTDLTFDSSDSDGLSVSSDVTAGTTVTAWESESSADSTAQFDSMTLRVTWSSGSGDSSATLGKWTGPEA
jgi:flagellin-like protein